MRILIADDHRVVLDGLKSCFESLPEVEVIGTATNGEEALILVKDLEPDIAVIDITMPGLNGIEACKRIHSDLKGRVKVAILTMHQDQEFVNAAFRAGASGFIVKSSAFSELGTAIETIMSGQFYLSPAISDVFVQGQLGEDSKSPANPISLLTSRERQIFQLLAEGLSVKEASFKLGISHKTVHAHRATIMKKLDIGNVAELTKLAIRYGITTLE